MPRRANGAGSVFLRKDGRWCFVVDLGMVDGRRKRRVFYASTREEVEAKALAEFPDLRDPQEDRPRYPSRYAAQQAAPGNHSRQQWWFKVRRADFRCHYCGVDCRTAGGVQRDHMVPLSRGGSNDLDNVVPCCKMCNYAKGTKTVEEWVR